MSKVALLLAGLSAVVGALLIHAYLNRLEQEVSGGEKISVLMVTRDVPVGAVLEKAMLGAKEIPSAFVTTRQIEAKDTTLVLGARVALGLKTDDSLQWTDLTETDGSRRQLSNLVQEGMRALSIKADHLFDGLLLPGDRVDVLFSSQQGSPASGTTTLLQNLLVLSVGGHTSRDDDSRDDQQASGSVTLSVSPLQGQILSHVLDRGRLDLTLRNSNDTSIVGNLPTTEERGVFGASTTKGSVTEAQRINAGSKGIEHVH